MRATAQTRLGRLGCQVELRLGCQVELKLNSGSGTRPRAQGELEAGSGGFHHNLNVNIKLPFR
jgi:hypothetical protein